MALHDHLISEFQISADPDEFLTEAASRMRFSDIGCLPVLSKHGDLIGILSERDLTRAIADGVDLRDTMVSDYMTPDPIMVDDNADPRTAATLMVQSGFRHLPVASDGHMIGIISIRDILVDLCWPEKKSEVH